MNILVKPNAYGFLDHRFICGGKLHYFYKRTFLLSRLYYDIYDCATKKRQRRYTVAVKKAIGREQAAL